MEGRRSVWGGVVWAAVVLASCTEMAEEERAAGHPDVERLVVGDTLVVRNYSETGVWGDTMTLEIELEIGAMDGPPELLFGDISDVAVRPDGSILVADRQVPVVREYDAEGNYVRSLGRRGEGPGEFMDPRAVRVDRQGRTLVLDWNSRMTIFGADGRPEKSWLFSNFYRDYNFTLDTLGNIYVLARGPQPVVGGGPPSEPVGQWLEYIRYSSDGTPGDTLPEGGWLFDPPGPRRLSIASPYGTKDNFKPFGIARIHPFGWTLTGSMDRYALVMTPHDDRIRTVEIDGQPAEWHILRVERVVDPAPFQEAEWAEWQAYLDASMERSREQIAALPLEVRMRVSEPTRPYFPETPVKPFLRWPALGDDGTLWITRYAPAVKEPPTDEPRPPSEPGVIPLPPLPKLTWAQPYVYDVFDVDGVFLGTVVVPLGLEDHVRSGDHVWGVRRDEMEVPYVFRAKLVPLRR